MQLTTGDRLVLLTDGILDAAPSREEPFGLDRLAAMAAGQRSTPPREFVRQVAREVLAHRNDHLLDDATLLCLDWRGEVAEAAAG